MKFSCTKENLNQGLTIVGHVANRTPNLPILQNILIKAGDGQIQLFATNLEIGIQATIRGKVDEPGEFTLPAQLFSNYVNLLASERIDCQLMDKELSVTAGKQHTMIKGEAATEFPILPEIDQAHTFILSKVELELALQRTVIAASLDSTRPEIAGVLFQFSSQQVLLAATDSYRLAESKVTLQTEVPDTDMKIILPYRSAQELARVLQTVTSETITVYATENQFACSLPEVQFISRIVEGNFPDYQAIIPQTGITTILVNTKDLARAVKGAALFSKEGINDVQLTFSAVQQVIELKSVNARLGENSSSLAATITGADVTTLFNYRYLIDGLQQIITPQVRIVVNDPMAAVGFYPETTGYVYIVMPIKQ